MQMQGNFRVLCKKERLSFIQKTKAVEGLGTI